MGRSRPPLPLLAAAAAVVTATSVPLLYLADRATERGWSFVLDELTAVRTVALVGRSMTLVAVVTALCVVLGVALAVLCTRATFPGRRALAVVLTLPLAIPSYLLAFLWISVTPSLAGFWGSVMVLVLVSYPFVMLTTIAALSRADPAQEEVARSLGLSGPAVILRVTLRHARASIAAGALLVALYVLSDFGAVAAMRYEVFTWVIYGAYRSGFNPSRAAVLSLVLLVFAVALVAAEGWARGRAAAYRVGAGSPRPAPQYSLGNWTPAALALPAVVVVAALVVPALELANWLRDVGNRWDGPEWLSAVASTAWLSVAAAVACTVAALPVGVLVSRYRSRSVRLLEGAGYVAHGLPGIVIAIAMIFVGVLVLYPLYQTAALLILSYVVLLVPLAIGSVRSAIEATPAVLEEVARSLGRRPLTSFAVITGRSAAPGIAAGAALVLVTCMKELPVTLLLRPTGTDTLATRLWGYSSISDYASAAPYAAGLVLFAAIPAALLGRWSVRVGEPR